MEEPARRRYGKRPPCGNRALWDGYPLMGFSELSRGQAGRQYTCRSQARTQWSGLQASPAVCEFSMTMQGAANRAMRKVYRGSAIHRFSDSWYSRSCLQQNRVSRSLRLHVPKWRLRCHKYSSPFPMQNVRRYMLVNAFRTSRHDSPPTGSLLPMPFSASQVSGNSSSTTSLVLILMAFNSRLSNKKLYGN